MIHEQQRFIIMLSDIERISPNIYNNMKIDIGEIVAVRKNRSNLFNEKYFTNKFWDIILLLYSYEIKELPINSKVIAADLELSHASVMRYLHALYADNVICAYDGVAQNAPDLARDNLSLSRLGFENMTIIVKQMRAVFAINTAL